jgi:hypothetical protein
MKTKTHQIQRWYYSRCDYGIREVTVQCWKQGINPEQAEWKVVELSHTPQKLRHRLAANELARLWSSMDRKKCLAATHATHPLRDTDVYEGRLHGSSLEPYVAHCLEELLIAHQTREKGDR